MRTRVHERESILTGWLLLYAVIFFLTTGCDSNPVGGCPRSPEPGRIQQADTTPEGIGPDEPVDINLFCIIFPLFCRTPEPQCWPDPFRPLTGASGHPDLPTGDEAWRMSQWHNACLSAWRSAERTPEGLWAAMWEQAQRLDLTHFLDETAQTRSTRLFESLLNGELRQEDLPDAELILASWQRRPQELFAGDEQGERLLGDLADGISAAEVERWRAFAESYKRGGVREYWIASSMSASVSWWHDFSLEVGENCSVGVFADLAAIQQTQDWRLVGIASLAGAIVDVLKHFWPGD